jgi:hypothetical protein
MHPPSGKPLRSLIGIGSVMTRRRPVRCGKSRRVASNGASGQRIARCPIMAVASKQTDANRIAAGHQAIAVVFDLVDPNRDRTAAARRGMAGQDSMKGTTALIFTQCCSNTTDSRGRVCNKQLSFPSGDRTGLSRGISHEEDFALRGSLHGLFWWFRFCR